MGNDYDKPFRALSPVTWVDAATSNRTYYYCPGCGDRVWAYGHMANTRCIGCKGRQSSSAQSATIAEQNTTIAQHETTISTQKTTIGKYDTAHQNMDTDRKAAKASAKEKYDELTPKIAEISNKYDSTDNKTNDSTQGPNLSDIDEDMAQLDGFLESTKIADAKDDEYVKASQAIGNSISEPETYVTDADKKAAISKARAAQQSLLQTRQNAHERDGILTEKANKLSKQKIDTERERITVRNNDTQVNKDEQKMDKLRTELGNVTGAEINADPTAYQEMKSKINSLCMLLKQKHINNQERIDELLKCEDRINTMIKKLDKCKLNNKYLINLLDEQYKFLSDAIADVSVKYEGRGTYFLAVTCGLTEFETEKMEGLVGDDHDMDMIKFIVEQDLIDAGINNHLLRKKIMKNIGKLEE